MFSRAGLVTVGVFFVLCGAHAQSWHQSQPTGAPLTTNGNSYLYPVTGNSGAQQGAALPQRPASNPHDTSQQRQPWRSYDSAWPAHFEKPRGVGDADSPEAFERRY